MFAPLLGPALHFTSARFEGTSVTIHAPFETTEKLRRAGWSATSHWSVVMMTMRAVRRRSKVMRSVTAGSKVVPVTHREPWSESVRPTVMSMMMTMAVLLASTTAVFEIHFAKIFSYDFILNRRFPVSSQINGILQGQLLVLLTQAILNRSRNQSNNKFVQQQRFQMLAKLAVHRQLLQPCVPRLDILAATLFRSIELGSLSENRNLRNELLSKQRAKLLVRLVLRRIRMTQVPQNPVGVRSNNADQHRNLVAVQHSIRLEELLQNLPVHGPVVGLSTKLRNDANLGRGRRHALLVT
uniref:(northern house mosquito) hypothetical protein n=1 Tax=Culex pipiens TaxID=7175 RepID=A0A8D8NZS2_CULPI